MSGWGDPHNLEAPRSARMAELDEAIRNEPPEKELSIRNPPKRERLDRHAEKMREINQRVSAIPRTQPYAKYPERVKKYFRYACQKHGVTEDMVLLGRSCQLLVEARAEIAADLRKLGMSYPQIGLYLRRHYTTIIHLLNRRKGVERIPCMPVSYEITVPDLSGEWAI